MKERLIRDYNISQAKICVVTNTEDKSFVRQQLDKNIYKELTGKFILTYSGGIGPHRGVDVAIRGMKYLENEEAIQLAIVGFGSKSVMDSLHKLVDDLQLKNVHFLGYQPFNKFYSYMTQCAVNIIPHQSNGHTDNTVPHKLFQGMMAGKPLLVSSCTPLKRIVENCNSGLVFQAGDPKDFANKVSELYENTDLQQELSANGLNATINGSLNWESTQKELISVYQSFHD
jgi:glycosyltransferase involved in cell wall biosynthesis